jgi:ring-1,2-phenylacetyl-CoA epoxidase subunit PaaD
VVSEGLIHGRIARARAGPLAEPARAASVDRERVLAILASVPDPELPVVSIVELGMVHDVDVDAEGIRVSLLPTFIGCPAIELIRRAVADALRPLDRPVDVATTLAVPWTSDRISPAGREALRRAGIAPPVDPADLRCPYCDAADVTLDNLFGATQCRSVHYCRACRQPFEAIKAL